MSEQSPATRRRTDRAGATAPAPSPAPATPHAAPSGAGRLATREIPDEALAGGNREGTDDRVRKDRSQFSARVAAAGH